MADMNKRGPDCNDCGDGEGGERGERGERGKRGKRGHDGRDGKDGHDGHDGHDGPTGPTGPGGGGGGGTGFTGPRGLPGPIGPVGPAGPVGATGPCCTGATGADGATGMTGADGSGVAATIIPFASGAPVVLTDILNVERTGAVIGFGNSGPTLDLLGGTLDLTGGPGVVLDMAWSMPDDGTLVQLTAMYSNVVAVSLPPGQEATVFVQLYRAEAGSNDFEPIGPALPLGEFDGLISLGETRSGSIPLGDVAVSHQDRLVLVAFVEFEGQVSAPVTTLTGYISAGLKIEL